MLLPLSEKAQKVFVIQDPSLFWRNKMRRKLHDLWIMEMARGKSKNKAMKISWYYEHSTPVGETVHDYKLLANQIYGERKLRLKCVRFGGLLWPT